MPFETLFTATATAKGGRHGHSQTSDGSVSVDLGMPRNGVLEPGKTTPEHLFAAGYAACFGSALEAVAKRRGVDASQGEVTVAASLGKVEDGFALAVKITGRISGQDRAAMQALLEEAHLMCPYSKATRGNIEATVSAA